MRHGFFLCAGAAALLAAGGAAPARGADVPAEPIVEALTVADERVFSAFVAAGAAFKPEYDGADKYEVVPLIVANLKWGRVELQVRGLDARVDLFADDPWDFGPMVRYRGKRDDDVSGPVKRLAEIDGAIETGGFVGYKFGGGPNGQGEIGIEATVLHDVSDAHDGFTVTGGVSYAAVRWGRFYANVDAEASYGSKDFNRTYFGVTRSGAAASGLRRYKPDAGFKDIGAGVTAGYQFSEKWGVLVRAGVTRYVGDAADSPIVKDGSKTAGLVGVGLTYRY